MTEQNRHTPKKRGGPHRRTKKTTPSSERSNSSRSHSPKKRGGPSHGSSRTNRSTYKAPRKQQGGGPQKNRRGGARRKNNARPPEKKLVMHRPSSAKNDDVIPPLADGTIRVIPLGGVEEIGRNMNVIEYGDDIVIVDMGFQFSEEATPGIDYILPNTKYLEDRKDKIRAVVITHGHLDHIGGIPYIMDKIGNPPIYGRTLTNLLIKKRQSEFPDQPAPDLRTVETEEEIKLGKDLKIRFFAVTHTIPDSMGVLIDTPYGSIAHTGDLKVDHVDGVPTKAEEETFGRLEKENILLLMADSTNVERPGFSIPESTVNKNIEDIIKNTKGRIIVGSYASQLERAMKIIEFAEKHGRKVVVDGRSMKTNLAVAKEAGYLKQGDKTVVPPEEMENYSPDKLLILATGSQGEEFAVLMRAANKTHKYLHIRKDDTIVLSSSIVPGNERSVQNLKDRLSRLGAHIVHYQVSDIHSSGHANRDESLWIHRKVGEKFFIPLHGYHYMLRVHADIAVKSGVPRSNVIIPDNSMIIEITDDGKKMEALPQKAPASAIMVDGFSVGDVQHVVLRDRQTLAQDGMFVIVASIDTKTGKLKKSPDIISRGFVYLRESQELLRETRGLVKKTIENTIVGMHPINFDYVKDRVSEDVTKHLLQKTAKRPIVIPVLLGL